MLVSDSLAAGVAARRAPRPMVQTLLAASAVAVLVTGLAGTALVLASTRLDLAAVPAAFWLWLPVAAFLTVASLTIRALRWTFLLRRGDVRVPIRDAFIGYLSGFTLLLVPCLIGEMTVRSIVQQSRAQVPIGVTCAVNLWERYLDLIALALLAAIFSSFRIIVAGWPGATLAAFLLLSAVAPVRATVLAAAAAVGDLVQRRTRRSDAPLDRARLQPIASWRATLVGVAASMVAWGLPAIGLWGLAGVWPHALSFGESEVAYAHATLSSGLRLAPGGVLVVGDRLLAELRAHGFAPAESALTVLAVRLATAGLATALGGAFLWLHARSGAAAAATHFDAIAHAYDVQIPESRRLALLDTKTRMMARVIAARGVGSRGLDVGCGQGWYVARMRALGFDVAGIDDSAAQVALARTHVNDPAAVQVGSALEIPAPDASFDFVYCINVLHHLPSVADQRRAFAEFTRVLRPGGLIFVHEINTRNLLFRLYMGYIFPSINCIDEGIERWLLAHRLGAYTSAPVVEVDYFTFLPDFLPAPIVRLFAPIERLLEGSPLRVYSAHYMATLRKPA